MEGRREKRENKENEKKGKEEEEKGRTGCSVSIFWRSVNQGVGIVHSLRGRGSLILLLFLSKGHSMAMRYSPNGGTGSRTVLIKLLIISGLVFGSFLFLEL